MSTSPFLEIDVDCDGLCGCHNQLFQKMQSNMGRTFSEQPAETLEEAGNGRLTNGIQSLQTACLLLGLARILTATLQKNVILAMLCTFSI